MAEPVRPAGDEREKGQDRRPSPTPDPARPATYLDGPRPRVELARKRSTQLGQACPASPWHAAEGSVLGTLAPF